MRLYETMHPKGYVCRKCERPPRLDGSLECPIWESAPWTDDFVDIYNNVVPRFRTRVKMLWDDDRLYIGADMEEPNLWATQTEHDCVIFHEHDFEVFIDPDGDNHNYFEIEINALNTTWDLRLPKPYRDGGPALNEWEAEGMLTAVDLRGKLNDPTTKSDGWSVVLAIPWSAFAEFGGMPCPPRESDHWRVNFSRVEWELDVVDGQYRKRPNRPEDNWVWSPQWVVDMHYPEMWGFVQFCGHELAEFVPDLGWGSRLLLMELYWSQRAFFEEHGRWATPSELSVNGVEFTLSEGGFEGKCGSLSIREDSRILHRSWERD